jgi:hypothetical protein
MKTYRQHKCEKKHRSYRTFAECAWKQKGIPVDASGDGPYASVSTCARDYGLPSYRRITTVHLYETAEDAEKAKKLIDDTACGGNCKKQHEVVRIQL